MFDINSIDIKDVPSDLYSRNKKYELSPKLLGLLNLNPFVGYVSASRQNMFSSHFGQRLTLKYPTKKRLITGCEAEYGKFCHQIGLESNSRIVKIIRKFPYPMSDSNAFTNPLTTVIYENIDGDGITVNHVDIELSSHMFENFGFDYEFTDELNQMNVGSTYSAGTVLAKAPSIGEDDSFNYGIELQTIFLTLPGVIEDGYVMRRGAAEQMQSFGYGERTMSFGKKDMPLNIYGRDGNDLSLPSQKINAIAGDRYYRIFPEIGQRIRPDGLLMAKREYDELLSPAIMSKQALMNPDPSYDELIYAKAGAIITDITVHKGNQNKSNLPLGMETQLENYYGRNLEYCKNVVKAVADLNREYRSAINLEPRLRSLLVHCHKIIELEEDRKLKATRRNYSLDEWEVTIKYKYAIAPTITFKVTGGHGDKGVVCDIWPDEHMPRDAEGNVADFIGDTDSTIKRMNVGRLYEHCISAFCRDLGKHIDKHWTRKPESTEMMWDYVYKFYAKCSPPMAELVKDFTPAQVTEHLKQVAKDGIYLWLPTDNPVSYPELIKWLRENYPICYGPVSYIDPQGKPWTTECNAMIGGMYIMLLEKTGKDWSAVASAKTQHHGVLAKLTRSSRYAHPARKQPVRLLGESEGRLFTAVMGGEFTADLLDQASSPKTHRVIVNGIVSAKDVSNVGKLIDRKQYPLGRSKPLLLMKQTLQCGGIGLERRTKK